ncbi:MULTISPECIES: TetR/AcrR family transcriptional regulator [unclassified Streptomyces]|uniref:TetR/AcrR family transcriptional regulator n=1 Tax=unclassified Streptomyces TaxID=2593676 RepID=UPI0011CEC95C|nr:MULTISPECIES: TetR/AcrR family transcriptional regulator [unclassified Streptomyces]TXS54815.1 TetR/AcrR family transcriptional regulator [Streptomyces sp. me109]
MTLRERRLREQAQRHRLILTTAREMAEAEGWDYVTTRRLADRIEYSQPVLYQHFKNKDAIVHAVALEGLAELAAELRAARLGTPDPRGALDAVARAYVDFAARGPVLYQAMLTLDPGDDGTPEETPGTGDAPAPLADVLAEIGLAVAPVAAGRDGDLLAEVLWSAWHGLAVLTGGGRLRPGLTGRRLAALTEVLLGPAAQPA